MYQRELGPGECLFAQGADAEQLFVVQEGLVELVRDEPSGRRVIARLGAGDFFGEEALQDRASLRQHAATAIKPTRVLEIDAGTLEAMCVEQPEIAIRMIRGLVSRLAESERRLDAIGSGDLVRQLARVLIRNAVPAPGRGVRIALNLRQIADQAGLSMLDAHRALHLLIDRKAVDLTDDVLVAPDLDTLSAALEAAS
jgi:CRP-like cAMP-binding protein